MAITLAFKRRTVYRLGGLFFVLLVLQQLFSSPTSSHEIAHNNYIERVTKSVDKHLDVHRLPFLQSRIGRDDDTDMLSDYIDAGTKDFWTRFQIPLYVQACPQPCLSANLWFESA